MEQILESIKYESPDIHEIMAAIGEFQNDILGKVKKDKDGIHKTRYATWDAIIEVAFPTLKKYELSVAQPYRIYNGQLGIYTIISHKPSKQWTSSFVPLNFDGKKDTERGGSTTYFKRYSLCVLLGIASDEDTDGQYGSGKHTSPSISQEPAISKDHLQELLVECSTKPGLLARIREKYNIDSLSDLYDREYIEIIGVLKTKK